MDKKEKNIMVLSHLTIALAIPFLTMIMIDMKYMDFNNVWEYFYLFTGMLGVLLFFISKNLLLFVPAVLLFRLLFILLIVIIHIKYMKLKYLMYIANIVLSIGTAFLGIFFMIASNQ